MHTNEQQKQTHKSQGSEDFILIDLQIDFPCLLHRRGKDIRDILGKVLFACSPRIMNDPVFTHTRKLDEVSLVHDKARANNASPSLKHPLFFLTLFLSIYENLFVVFFIAWGKLVHFVSLMVLLLCCVLLVDSRKFHRFCLEMLNVFQILEF